MYVIVHEDLGAFGQGARLCNDEKFRIFANFSESVKGVKIYKSKKWAMRSQTKFEKKGVPVAVVRIIPKRQKMDSSGFIHNI